jgi:hypothetical protein
MSELYAGDGNVADQSLAAQAQEKAQQTAQQASRRAGDVLRTQAETRTNEASEQLHAVAHAMRRTGHQLRADGRPTAGAVDGITERIEQLATYLGNADGDRLLHDVESFGRRRPWGMIGIGLGLGIAASRFLKASSSSRYGAVQQQRQLEFSSPRMPAAPHAPSSATPSAEQRPPVPARTI